MGPLPIVLVLVVILVLTVRYLYILVTSTISTYLHDFEQCYYLPPPQAGLGWHCH